MVKEVDNSMNRNRIINHHKANKEVRVIYNLIINQLDKVMIKINIVTENRIIHQVR